MGGRRAKFILLCLAVLSVLALALPFWVGYSFLHHRDRNQMSAAGPSFDRTPLLEALAASGFALGDAAYIQIFKRERRLELYLQRSDGRFGLFRFYPICHYSGTLGPKLAEGDRQAPEGFYKVGKSQLNPNSRHHLAFNLGFPNAYDRHHGRSGSFLMVHGGCSSAGCYAMTDEKIDEIYAVVEAALEQGQEAVDVAAFPFILGEDALKAEAGNHWAPYWENLKQGFDLFVASATPPKVGICDGQYRFGANAEAPGCAPIAGWA